MSYASTSSSSWTFGNGSATIRIEFGYYAPPPPRPQPVRVTAWQVLGVTEGASLSQVKAAYRRLARRYHPDVEGGSEEKMKVLNAAFDWAKERASQ